MHKKLTKRQKTIEATRQIKNFVNEQLVPKLIKDVKTTLKNENLPDEWMFNDDYLLCKYVIDRFCLERPFAPMSEETKNEFKKLNQ